MMQFLITHVDFDVDNDDLTSEELALDYVGEIWEADDEDDLIEDNSSIPMIGTFFISKEITTINPLV